MSDPIRMHCEHCGAGIQAPHEMAGHINKCPACGNTLYVPTPENEIEELPLATEDKTELAREARLQAERRRLDSLLAHEYAAPAGDDAGNRTDAPATGARPAAGRAGMADSAAAGTSAASNAGNRVEQTLLKYLVAVRDSDLDAADRALKILKLQPRTTRDLIDRFATDAMPPPELTSMPIGVYQGMLKNLRGKL